MLEAPLEEVERLAGRLRTCMVDALAGRVELRVPLEVDVGAGPNWLDVAEIHFPGGGQASG